MTDKRIKPVPEGKVKIVQDLADKIKASRTVLIASTKGLPSSQFHEIKKNLRGKADIKVAKKSAVIRAIGEVQKGALQNLKNQVVADIAIFFSDLDCFELSALLSDSQSPAKARAGDIAPEDISIEAGPTELVPGPAISELSSVGLKVAVENGKLTIRQGALVAKAGEEIKENVASVLSKLGVTPMRVGFEPLAAYDSKADKVYTGIKIDKKAAFEELRTLIAKAFSFSLNIAYVSKDNISYLIAKATNQEKAISGLLNKEMKAEEKQ